MYLLPNLFPKTCRPALERFQYSTQLVPEDFSQGVKRPVREVEQSPQSTAEVTSQATFLVLFNDFILFTGTTLTSTFLQRLPRGLWHGFWGCSLAGIAGSNTAEDMNVCLFSVMYIFSDRSLCDELINRLEASYRVWCV